MRARLLFAVMSEATARELGESFTVRYSRSVYGKWRVYCAADWVR
jgi:hypothetical protein